jgi:hypothetical protein
MCEYLLIPFVEFEIRFGTNNVNKFDSNVDKKYFEKILQTLETGTFKNVVTTKTTEYIKDSLRLVNDSEIIMKESVLKNTITMNDSPFDIRLSISQEFKLKSYIKSFDKKDCLIRVKDRKSFIDDNFRYDLTVVNQKSNGVNTTFYEIEIELLVNNETLCWDTDFINIFLECKIYDIINIVEPLDRDKFKIKVL